MVVIAWYVAMGEAPKLDRRALKAFHKSCKPFVWWKDALWKTRKAHRGQAAVRVVGNIEHQAKILTEEHGRAHRGREATFQAIAARFWWPKLYQDVVTFVRSCDPCQRDGGLESVARYGSREVLPVAREWAIDFVVMPRAQGKRYILDARCTFSGWAEAVPTRQATGKEVVKFLQSLIK